MGSEDRPPPVAEVARSIVDAARREWPGRFVSEPGIAFHPVVLYTETHFALASVLLYLHDRRDASYLDLAEERLRLWNEKNGPATFFNSMAFCLTAIVLQRSGATHAGLTAILAELLRRTKPHRHVAWDQWCGNNAYLQQVAVDTVLHPVATGAPVREDDVQLLLGEFRKFATPEGFFFDLPRTGTDREPLHPPAYVMKMLFLAGICDHVHPHDELARLFRRGVAAALPLLSREGTLAYFGRTDNSPFGTALTIFNLRKAAHLFPEEAGGYIGAARAAERTYATFPRTGSGVLESNRFMDSQSQIERERSRDAYAYVGQYSLASAAYALLGCHWYPIPEAVAPTPEPPAAVATSSDLKVARLTAPGRELIIRTGSEPTSWDRRYLGPTILRYEADGQLLVGAISRTISTDRAARERSGTGRLGRLLGGFRERFTAGFEHLDGTSVGYLPVIRRGSIDYLPHTLIDLKTTPSGLAARYRMVKLRARGLSAGLVEATNMLHQRLPGLKPREYVRPNLSPDDSFALERVIRVDDRGCRLEDRITGDLSGARVLFSVRAFERAAVRVEGLTRSATATGWGSEGRQTLTMYETTATGAEVRYACEIGVDPASR